MSEGGGRSGRGRGECREGSGAPVLVLHDTAAATRHLLSLAAARGERVAIASPRLFTCLTSARFCLPCAFPSQSCCEEGDSGSPDRVRRRLFARPDPSGRDPKPSPAADVDGLSPSGEAVRKVRDASVVSDVGRAQDAALAIETSFRGSSAVAEVDETPPTSREAPSGHCSSLQEEVVEGGGCSGELSETRVAEAGRPDDVTEATEATETAEAASGGAGGDRTGEPSRPAGSPASPAASAAGGTLLSLASAAEGVALGSPAVSRQASLVSDGGNGAIESAESAQEDSEERAVEVRLEEMRVGEAASERDDEENASSAVSGSAHASGQAEMGLENNAVVPAPTTDASGSPHPARRSTATAANLPSPPHSAAASLPASAPGALFSLPLAAGSPSSDKGANGLSPASTLVLLPAAPLSAPSIASPSPVPSASGASLEGKKAHAEAMELEGAGKNDETHEEAGDVVSTKGDEESAEEQRGGNVEELVRAGATASAESELAAEVPAPAKAGEEDGAHAAAEEEPAANEGNGDEDDEALDGFDAPSLGPSEAHQLSSASGSGSGAAASGALEASRPDETEATESGGSAGDSEQSEANETETGAADDASSPATSPVVSPSTPIASMPVASPSASPASAPSSASSPPPPLRIRNYVIDQDRPVGSGGLGRVFVARHTGGRKVALKLGAPLDWKDFTWSTARTEWNAYAALGRGRDLPWIPDVYQFGLHGGPDGVAPWLTMELLGPTLHDLCGRRMGPARAARLGRAALRSLRALHNRGFLHRDVKPENLATRPGTAPEDQIVLIDLGMAVQWLPGNGAVRPRFAGTPDYAGERALREQALGPREDILSLAYSLLFLATGDLPWSGLPDRLPRRSDGPAGWSRAELAAMAEDRKDKWAKAVENGAAPTYIRAIVEHCDRVAPTDVPNYAYLDKLLEHAAKGQPETPEERARVLLEAKKLHEMPHNPFVATIFQVEE